jgi:hypothetical protein
MFTNIPTLYTFPLVVALTFLSSLIIMSTYSIFGARIDAAYTCNDDQQPEGAEPACEILGSEIL